MDPTVIIGGGPTGLTLATYLPGPVVLIEAESTLGGCHRVRRDRDGFFSEHGPRVYNGCYVNVEAVMRDIGLSWSDIFAPTTFSPEHIDGKHWYRWFSARETMVFVAEYLAYMVDDTHGRHLSMRDFCRRRGFSERTTEYIDAVCRFSDGAGIDRYSLWEFLSGFDQHVSPFYEPRAPLDQSLFPRWRSFLESRGVVVKLDTRVARINHERGAVTGVTLSDGTVLAASRVLCAIPPPPMASLLRASQLVEPGFDAFASETEYATYASVSYHFPRDAVLPNNADGLRTTPWGLVYINMASTMQHESTAVLSVAATRLDVPSPHTGKSANDSSADELTVEILRQLPVEAASKARLVRAVISSGLYKNRRAVWDDRDDAYVASAHSSPVGAVMTCCDGLYSIGCHNGRSRYHFTSMEAAVENALVFAGRRPMTARTMKNTIVLALVCVIVAAVAYRYRAV